jgi:small subunit ribosomal protein S1
VVSQRLAVANPVSQKRGTLVSGVVTGIRDYGVFVDLVAGATNTNSNTPALLHVSQVSAERATDLQALFTVGETLQVVVMDHDVATGRIALSTKCLELSPGDMLRDKAGVQANASANLEK